MEFEEGVSRKTGELSVDDSEAWGAHVCGREL